MATGGSKVFAGGGDDTLSFGQSSILSNVTSLPQPNKASTLSVASSNESLALLHGGLGNDTVIFTGASTDYTVEKHNGYQSVYLNTQPDQRALVINAEQISFSDGTVAVDNSSDLNTITGLYQTMLGRQGDYMGVDYWGESARQGVSLGRIAIEMISCNEVMDKLHSTGFNGDVSHDIELLYQGIFNRSSDVDGMVYWTNAMNHGMTLEQVAQNFVIGNEFESHKIDMQHWNFIV